jgi:selenophosphate synthetase-related protein
LPIVSRIDFDSDRKYLIARKALDRNVDFGHTLIDFPKEFQAALDSNNTDEVRKILSKLSEKLTAIATILQDIRTAP